MLGVGVVKKGWWLMGHWSRAWNKWGGSHAVVWGKSSRQKEQQAQVPDAEMLRYMWGRNVSSQKRRAEEMKPLRITSQTKLCCKIPLCCLDIIKVKIGIKPYYKNGSNCPWPVWLSWLEHCPMHQKVTGSIPSQGKYLVCKINPRSWHVGEVTDRCVSHQCFLLSLTLPPPL